jgi:GMP synthase-like glutamine amidotransferase
MRPVVIFRFAPTEGPGYLADWLDARRLPWRLVALDAGEPVPADPTEFAGIAMMGGPMSVNDPSPWGRRLNDLLRDAVALRVPVIGHCLGGQLFAQALGARVARAATPEIGWLHVDVCDSAARREWFGGLPRFAAFQWHHDAFELPPMATRVLTNAFCRNQAFVVDDIHIGFQCHIEMTRPLVESWLEADAGDLPSASTATLQTAADIRRDLDPRLAALAAVADTVYARWVRALRG